MQLNEYQKAAMQTAIYPTENNDGLHYAVHGLCSEAGEVADKLKKAMRDGDWTNFNSDMCKELGDCMWYIAAIARELGFDLEFVGQRNIAKLQSRATRNVLGGSGDER